jgi:hypothetical protein
MSKDLAVLSDRRLLHRFDVLSCGRTGIDGDTPMLEAFLEAHRRGLTGAMWVDEYRDALRGRCLWCRIPGVRILHWDRWSRDGHD